MQLFKTIQVPRCYISINSEKRKEAERITNIVGARGEALSLKHYKIISYAIESHWWNIY